MAAKQLSIRLSPAQIAHITDRSEEERTTPTDIIRQLIDADRRGGLAEAKSLAQMIRLNERFSKVMSKLDEYIDAIDEEHDEDVARLEQKFDKFTATLVQAMKTGRAGVSNNVGKSA